MHINLHPRPLSIRTPYTIPPRHHRTLVEMSSSDFNSLSAASVPAGGAEGCDWDTATAMEGLFQDGYSVGHYADCCIPPDDGRILMFQNPPLLAPAAAFGGAYNAFQPENGASNTAAGRGFETQSQQQQQQQFSMQMLSYTTNKFVPRAAASSFQVSQANEYWASLAASTTTNQNHNWKMDYNSNNAVLSDFTRCGGAYDEFTPLPLQTGGRLSSFSLGEDGQSPDDILHFSPDGDGQGYGEKRWNDNLKHHEQSTSHHGLPYTFFDDTTANPPLSIFPPGPAAHWNDTTHLDTVSPKALTLSSSSVSFSGSSSSDCGSIDSVSTTDGFFSQSAGDKIQGIHMELEQEKREVEVRHKLPTRPLRQYVAIAPSLGREGVVEAPRMVKVCPPPFLIWRVHLLMPSDPSNDSAIAKFPAPPRLPPPSPVAHDAHHQRRLPHLLQARRDVVPRDPASRELQRSRVHPPRAVQDTYEAERGEGAEAGVDGWGCETVAGGGGAV